ncbi:MAG: heparinase II/III family protein [Marinilabiliaceae bacterium]|nr:heparinase II/III family protein [Marinilabiliaceae bacterium]
MRKLVLSLISICLLVPLYASDKGGDRDVMQVAAQYIDWSSIQRPEYPSYSNRKFWNNLPANWQQAYITEGEEYVDYTWPAVTATRYLRFMQDGDRKSMENLHNERSKALRSLVLAELVEGEGRFMNPIIDGVFAICEQTSWCNSAHLVSQKTKGSLPDVTEPIIDLGSVKMGVNLSMIHYFFKAAFDQVNPLISQRIEYEIQHRLLQPYYERDDFWWMGFRGSFVNNWNVWCNANVLKCMWLIEDDPEQRARGIEKIIRSADKFVNYYHEDGACEEGPEYWGHAGGKLYELIETLNAMSGGQFKPYANDKVKNIGRYIQLAHISGNYFVNFADASPKLKSYPGLIKRIGQMIEDDGLESFAKELATINDWQENAPQGNLGKVIPDLVLGNKWLDQEDTAPMEQSFFFEQTGMCVARDKGTKSKGFFFAAKGGHNNESHNHNDVGTFILYYNGKPFLVDAGVGTYTAKTFSSRRYELWNMQSEQHNLPLINGFGQQNGKQYKAENLSFTDDCQQVSFSLNIESAYPEEAKIREWKRRFNLIRTEGLVITEDYDLKKCVQPTEYRFVTPYEVSESSAGKLLMDDGKDKLFLYFDATQLEWEIQAIGEMDERLSSNWPDGLKLLVLKHRETRKKATVEFKVLNH